MLFRKVKILYTDGDIFFIGWLQDLGGNSGPIVFRDNFDKYEIDHEITFRSRKYEIKDDRIYEPATLRVATAADADNLLDLRFQNYFDGHYNKISAYQAFGQKFDDYHVTIVAEIDNLIIGHAYLLLDVKQQSAILDDLFVDHTYRQCGHGSALLRAAEIAAADSGCKLLNLRSIGTKDFVNSKQRFYRTRGFELLNVGPESHPDWVSIDLRKNLQWQRRKTGT